MRARLLVTLMACGCLFASCRNGAQAELGRATQALFEKKPHDALTYYRRALDELDRDTSPETPVLRARALRGAADIYFLELHDIPHAIEVYRELIRQCPDAAETMEGRVRLAGLLHQYKRDVRGAINELAAAIARNPPQSAELSYQVAKLYFELGDYQQAEVEAGNVAKKYGTSPYVDDALLLRGQALGMIDTRHADAQKVFHALADTFPKSELVPHALFELGKLLSEAEEKEKAIELFVRALATHPDPKVVQSHIARVRRRIANTTPSRIGDHASAFGHNIKPKDAVLAPKVALKNHKSSVEAAGGTAAEARNDRGD